MLVLARKENETIAVGTSIIRVLEIRGNLVRIGIEADPDIQILRGELMPDTEPLDLVEV